MKTMSPPAGVQTRPTETPGFLTRSSTSLSARNFGTPSASCTTSGVTTSFSVLPSAMRRACLRIRCGDFAFQIPHAGFARVAVNDFAQAVVGELDLLADLDSVLGRLLRNQVLVGDVDFFDLGVAREAR